MQEQEERSLEELWQLYPIILRAHNPAYAIWYEEEKARLLQLLRDHPISRVSHIGSTAVAGLIAKPTVDILLELPAGYDINAVVQLLPQDDWIPMQQNDALETLDLGKGYTSTGFAERVFHLHVKPSGDWGELYFRDYLREHADIARQYEALKRTLKMQFEHNRDAYTGAKSAFVLENTQRAREEYAGRYQPPDTNAAR